MLILRDILLNPRPHRYPTAMRIRQFLNSLDIEGDLIGWEADILPTSMETVKVGGKLALHRAFVTLEGLAKLQTKWLPRLRSVELNGAITA